MTMRRRRRELKRRVERWGWRLGGWFQPRALVLLYHRVVPEVGSDPLRLKVSCENFERHLTWLAKHCTPVSIGGLAERLAAGRLRRRQVVVTFDDGYRDNRQFAAEILLRQGIPAVFYLTAGGLGTERRFYWDEAAARCQARLEAEGADEDASRLQRSLGELCTCLRRVSEGEREVLLEEAGPPVAPPPPEELPMNWEEARELSRLGFTIGAHTWSHPALSAVSPEIARWEITASRNEVERRLGVTVRDFAYPYDETLRWGAGVPAECRRWVAEAGFQTAVTVRRGPVTRGCGLLELPRLAVGDWPVERFAWEVAPVL